MSPKSTVPIEISGEMNVSSQLSSAFVSGDEGSKAVEKIARRIQKKKKKIMLAFSLGNNASSNPTMAISGSENCTGIEEEENDQPQQQYRSCTVYVPRPLNEIIYFIFSGFITVELENMNHFYIADQMILSINSIEKFSRFYTASPSFQAFSKEFDLAIRMLENLQDRDQYEFAQMLKKYKSIAQESTALLSSIKQEFARDSDALAAIQEKRKSFRDESIKSHVTKLMQEDDFFMCNDMGMNFNDASKQPSTFNISSNLFALLGIDEQHVSSFLVRKDAFMRMIPCVSRKRLSHAELVMHIEDNGRAKNSSVVLEKFEIHTIDQIVVYCDIRLDRFRIEFPEELLYPKEFAVLDEHGDAYEIIQLMITADNIETVMRTRAARPEPVFDFVEDLEYSVLSSIFIEKFYEHEVKKLSLEQHQPTQEELDEIERKTCKYRSIL